MIQGYLFGIDCQTTLQVQEKLISRLPIAIYVSNSTYFWNDSWVQTFHSFMLLLLLLCPDTGQHRSSGKNINIGMETKAKKLNCLLPYWGPNRFSLGQISELLRLIKESYCNFKLKCSDTGQHTVLFWECTVTDLCFLNKVAVRTNWDCKHFYLPTEWMHLFYMLWNWHCPTDLSRRSEFNSSNSSLGSQLQMMTPSVLCQVFPPPPPSRSHSLPIRPPKKCKFLPRAARLLK